MDEPLTEDDKLLVLFKAELARVYTMPEYNPRPDIVITGLLHVAEGLMRRIVRIEPGNLPILLPVIDRMRSGVEKVAVEAETPTPMPPLKGGWH